MSGVRDAAVRRVCHWTGSDASAALDHGKGDVQTCSRTGLTLSDSEMSDEKVDVGAMLVQSGTCGQPAVTGNPAATVTATHSDRNIDCVICGDRIRHRHDSRPWPAGSHDSRAHHNCTQAVKRGDTAVAAAVTATVKRKRFRSSSASQSRSVRQRISSPSKRFNQLYNDPNEAAASSGSSSHTISDIGTDAGYDWRAAVNGAVDILTRMVRQRKPYALLSSRGRHNRRKEAGQLLSAINVTFDQLTPSTPAVTVTAAAAASLPRSTRDTLRQHSIALPNERQIAQVKESMAVSEGTATDAVAMQIAGDNVSASYLSDPIQFLTSHTKQSRFIAIGGDCGSGITKIGVTFKDSNSVTRFATLITAHCSDDFVPLSAILTYQITFTGASSSFHSMQQLLQSVIDNPIGFGQRVFINGDWKFINALMGQRSASATYPCPICLVHKYNLFDLTQEARIPALRGRQARQWEQDEPTATSHQQTQPQYGSQQAQPLLKIEPWNIVPTPLHLFLGIGNRLIEDVCMAMIGEKAVLDIIQELHVKTFRWRGTTGASQFFELNGPELERLFTSEFFEEVHEAAKALAADTNTSPSPPSSSSTFQPNPQRLARMDDIFTIAGWIGFLHERLLHKERWSDKEHEEWLQVVADMWKQWQTITQKPPPPKLHMLAHVQPFVKRYGVLQSVSESATESTHAMHNRRFAAHGNLPEAMLSERHRRALADITLTVSNQCKK